MNDIRDKIQSQAKNAFLATTGKASIVVGTGVGKSKIAIDIIRELCDFGTPAWNQWCLLRKTQGLSIGNAILVLVNSERLRDTDWKDQFKKFNFSTLYVRVECYQTVYKWVGETFYAVIADEFDFSLTPEYFKFYLNNKFTYLIGLTALIPEKKLELANLIAPVCFSYTTQQAQADGVLNPTKFYQVNFDLSQAKVLDIKAKGYTFKQHENGAYLYLDEQFNKALHGLSATRKKQSTAELFDNNSTTDYTKQIDKLEGQMKFFSRKRKDFLHSLQSSVQVAKLLANTILKNNTAKVLIFSKLNKQSSAISHFVYNSTNKQDFILDSLNTGGINQLGVCEALTRGANLVGVNNIIEEAYVGSDVDFQQKHGRGVRLPIGDSLKFFILVPHVWERVKNTENGVTKWEWKRRPTQAGVWFKNMTEGFDLANMQTIEVTHDPRTNTYSIPTTYDDIFTSR